MRTTAATVAVAVAVALGLLGTALVSTACSDGDDAAPRRTSTTQGPPSARSDVEELVGLDPQFAPFMDLVAAADTSVLTSRGPITFVVPDADAVAAVGPEERARLAADRDAATDLLRSQVLKGRVTAAGLVQEGGGEVTTVDGATLPATVEGTRVRIAGVPLTRNDIVAANGMVQVAGGFLDPAAAGIPAPAPPAP